jgi:hypothetical protein
MRNFDNERYFNLLVEIINDPTRKNFKNIHQIHDAFNDRIRELRNREQTERAASLYTPETMLINRDWEASDFADKLETEPFGIADWHIKIARDYATLLSWGNYMHNCIAGYIASQVLLGGVYYRHELVANFELQVNYSDKMVILDDLHPIYEQDENQCEVVTLPPAKRAIKSYTLAQLLGKYNKSLDTATKDHIKRFLSNQSVSISERGWF